jgi:hypothetical protein
MAQLLLCDVCFCILKKCITGDNLATHFVDALTKLDLRGSVFAITTDNAGNMVKMVEKVEEIIRQNDHSRAQPCVHRMFCIGHVLNLTVQEILKAGIGLGPADQIVDMGIDSSRGKPVDKLRQGVVWIRSSPQNMERFKGCCKTSDSPELQLSLDVRTRWNSTYEMIQRAHLLSPAFDLMMGSGPEHMRLSASDWQFLKVALLILQPFEDFTKLNSASRYAAINMATISYVNLRSILATTYTILC